MDKWYKILVYLIASLIIASCNPFISKELRHKKKCNHKLEKLTRKCPGLLKTDTILIPVLIEIPPIDIDTLLLVNKDVSGIDSIIAKYQEQIDSILARKIGKEIKWYVRERPCIIDTLEFEENGIKVKVFQQGKQIRISIKKPKEKIKTEIKIEVPIVQKIKLTSWEKFMGFLGRFWLWIVVISIIGIIVSAFKKRIKDLFKL